jgi:hypothetical protein
MKATQPASTDRCLDEHTPCAKLIVLSGSIYSVSDCFATRRVVRIVESNCVHTFSEKHFALTGSK